MNLTELLHLPIVHALGWTLLNSLWQAAAVAALLAPALWLLRRAAPQARYVACGLAMMLVILLPTASFCLVPSKSIDIPEERPVAQPVAVELQSKVSTSPETRVAMPGMPVAATPASSAESPLAASPLPVLPPVPWPARLARGIESALPWAVAAWLAGVLVMSVWHLGGWIAVQRLRVLGIQPIGRDLELLASRLAARMGLVRRVRVVRSLLVETPLVFGLLRPLILLPAAILTGLTPNQLESILAHELAHVYRHDYLVNLLQTVVQTLLFYHPAVWWISRRMRLEREQCCDDVAASLCGGRIGYAEALAAVEEVRAAIPAHALAARGAGEKDFVRRIRRLLNIADAPVHGVPRSLVGALGIVAVLAITIVAHSLGGTAATAGDARAESGAEAAKDAERAAPPTAEPQLRLELDLVDGSHITGIPNIDSVPVRTSYAKMDIPLNQIVTMKIGDNHETASLELQNGDKLKGVVSLAPITLKTVFGKVSVDIEHIRELRGVLSGGPLPEGLVAYFPFDGDAEDRSGNRNNGKLVGACFQRDEGSGKKVLQVEGNNSSYVVVPQSASLEPTDGITISMWVKGQPGQAAGYGWGTLLRKADHMQPGYAIRGGGISQFGVGGPGKGASVTFREFTSTKWQHIVATYSREAASMETYQDGNRIDQKSLAEPLVHSGDLYIGGANVFGDDGGFRGLIAEVRIFGRGLSAAEVRTLYGLGLNRRYRAGSGRDTGKTGEMKITVPGNSVVDAGKVTKGQRYWFEASGLVGINVGGPNGGPAHKADPDGRIISQVDGTVTAPNPADARFPCPGLATHSLVGMIGVTPTSHIKSGEEGTDDRSNSGCVQLGSKGSFVAPASGRLTLLCNDLIPGDNSGTWDVKIGSEPGDAVAWGESVNGLQAGLSLKGTSREPKPSATFVLTVRNVGREPVRILKLSSYAVQYGIPPLEIRSDGKIVQYQGLMFEPAPPPDESQYIMLKAGDSDSTEVTLALENWKLTPPFDAEVVFVLQNGKAEGLASFVDNGTRKMKTVGGLWTGEARSKAVSMKMTAGDDKKGVVPPAKTVQAATTWTDSADGKVSVCLSVDKKTFSPDEPIVVRCAVRNNTKEPLLVLRPFTHWVHSLPVGLSILGSKGTVQYQWALIMKPKLATNLFHELPAGMTLEGTQEFKKDVLSRLGEVGLYKIHYAYISGFYAKEPKSQNLWEGTVTPAEVQILVEKRASKTTGESKTAPRAPVWTDSADGKVSVCLSVNKGSHGELAEVSCGEGHCKSATYSVFSADEPIVVRCAVRNNTKEPLLVLRPFVAGQYAGMSILGPNGKVEYKGVHGKPPLGAEMFQEVSAGMIVEGTQELRKDDLSGFGEVGLYKVRYEYVSNSSSYAKKPKPKNLWEGTVTPAEVQILVEK